jgi:cyclic beta-1,2-glucan synthetase
MMKRQFLQELADTQPPYRSGMMDQAQIAAHCKKMAAQQRFVAGANLQDMSVELIECEKVFWEVYKCEAIPDSFYIILDQTAKTWRLLRQLDYDLPRIVSESGPGLPRVYDLAVSLVSLTDSRLEPENINAFVAAYQSTAELQEGELRAVQAMLRLALISNLKRLAVRLPALGICPLPEDISIADQVSMRSCISSLRLLDTVDWQNFVMRLSLVEAVLKLDSAGVYTKMENCSREYYRAEVGKIARMSGKADIEVARWAVVLSKYAVGPVRGICGGDHVGFYLIGEGRTIMERSVGIRRKGLRIFTGLPGKFPFYVYLGGIISIILLMTGLFLPEIFGGMGHPALTFGAGLLFVLCTAELAKLTIDAFTGYRVVTVPLPRLDFSPGIPREHRTMVVIPSLLISEKDISELAHMLEVRFIANKDENLCFGLLTDHEDADEERMPEDHHLLDTAMAEIKALNARYRQEGKEVFFLFHRARKWNPTAKKWMGYERKRGKLMELNALLRGKGEGLFSCIVGDHARLEDIRYVICLDADTQLPRDMAWKMVATMAHPLNRAVYNEEKRRVTSGYGVLQPRIGTDLCGTKNSLYQYMYGYGPDVDPYSFSAPDVYQDLFGEGSYVGKGIYDVDVMLKALSGQFPENRVLSHDLLEGSYVRAGLLNDLKLFEPPPDYWVDVKRRHRWIRGDWQIAAWLGPFVPGSNGRWVKNPLSVLSCWKILDNLRKSLLPVALFLLLCLGWTVSAYGVQWTLFVLFVMFFPALTIIMGKILERAENILSPRQWVHACKAAGSRMRKCVYKVICLPYEAFFTAHAIILACGRMLFQRKNLMEWVSSGRSVADHRLRWGNIMLKMWPAPLVSLLLACWLLLFRPMTLGWASPLLILWVVSPLVAWYFSRPGGRKERVTQGQELFLRKQARMNWAYFDHFAGSDNNWLPPDHYQQHPVAKLAEYTSPTNMGLSLLANLTAGQLGYITHGSFVERTSGALDVMSRLERFRGHFYNWYNLRLLQPSPPRYVSTVDSGNLVGHLYVLRCALRALPAQSTIGPALFQGMVDTLEVLEAVTGQAACMDQYKMHIRELAASSPLSFLQVKVMTGYLTAAIPKIAAGQEKERRSESVYWLAMLQKQLNDVIDELAILAPWLSLPEPPDKYKHLLPCTIPSLTALSEISARLTTDLMSATLPETQAEHEWLAAFSMCMTAAGKAAAGRMEVIDRMIRQCNSFTDIEYSFLYNSSQQMLSIGYQVEAGRQDTDCYDVLASEARLATYVGICQGKLPVRSWFSLGRTLANIDHSLVLLSANGTLFEYLMPLLVMPGFDKSILDQGCRAAIQLQMASAAQHGIPWGISESCYNILDADQNYQYKVFGIPALSIRHAYSEEDRVVAPYASMLALLIAPKEACTNLQRLTTEGMQGRYGLFEAIDYTHSRMQGANAPAIVRTFMAHHQGMGLLSMASLLLNRPLEQLFSADAELASSLLMLQERVPDDTILRPRKSRKHRQTTRSLPAAAKDEPEVIPAEWSQDQYPSMQLLSNGRWHTMLTAAGRGYRTWKDIIVTQWTETSAPMIIIAALPDGGSNKTEFFTAHAEFTQEYNDLQVSTKVTVSPDEDLEVWLITIRNSGIKQRPLTLTSFVQPVLAPWRDPGKDGSFAAPRCVPETDNRHHAVFYSTHGGLTGDCLPCLFHTMHTESGGGVSVCYEPAVHAAHATTCPSPVVIRHEVLIGAGDTMTSTICLGIGENRQSCEALFRKVFKQLLTDEVFQRASTYSREVLKQINATTRDLYLFRRFAAVVLFPDDAGLPPAIQSSLLHPTVLIRIAHTAHTEMLEHMIRMHAYWRLKGLAATLVIWNEDKSSYRDFLQRLIIEMITGGIGAEVLNRHGGGIFVKMSDAMMEEDLLLLQTATAVISADEWNKSPEQLWRQKTNRLSWA